MYHNICLRKVKKKKNKPPVGLEPTIYRLEVCRLIHWATGANLYWRSHRDSNSGYQIQSLMC